MSAKPCLAHSKGILKKHQGTYFVVVYRRKLVPSKWSVSVSFKLSLLSPVFLVFIQHVAFIAFVTSAENIVQRNNRSVSYVQNKLFEMFASLPQISSPVCCPCCPRLLAHLSEHKIIALPPLGAVILNSSMLKSQPDRPPFPPARIGVGVRLHQTQTRLCFRPDSRLLLPGTGGRGRGGGGGEGGVPPGVAVAHDGRGRAREPHVQTGGRHREEPRRARCESISCNTFCQQSGKRGVSDNFTQLTLLEVEENVWSLTHRHTLDFTAVVPVHNSRPPKFSCRARKKQPVAKLTTMFRTGNRTIPRVVLSFTRKSLRISVSSRAAMYWVERFEI